MITTHYSKRRKILYSFYISFIICMLCSCGGHHYPPSLQAADSLMEVNPDSTVALLRQLRPQMERERKAVRMYHRLLTIKAADKTDQLQPVADSILPLVKYYEEWGDKSLLPTAYYYAGRTYFELHDAPQALDYFQKAAEVAGDDWELEGCIYSNIGHLYLNQGLYNLAELSFKKEYDLSRHKLDTLGIIYALKDIAFAKEAGNHHQEALDYLNKALCMSQLNHNRQLSAYICQSLAVQHTIMNHFNEAHHYLDNCLDNIALLDSNVVYYTLAKLYNRESNEDSLLYYCGKLHNYTPLHAKDSICRFLLKVSLNRGEHIKAQNYLNDFLIIDDSIKKTTETDALIKVKALYDYRLREKDNLLLKQKNKKMWYVILGVLASVIGLVVYLLYYREKQSELALQYMRSEQLRLESYKKSQQSIEENERRIAELEEALKAYSDNISAEKYDKEKMRLRLVSETQIAKLKREAHEKADQFIGSSKICQRFLHTANGKPTLHPTDDDWKELELFLNETYDSFCIKLRSQCKMSDIKYRVSLLVKIRMDTRNISEMLNTSKSNVSTIRSRLYKEIFGKEGGASDWDDFIWGM